MKADGPGDLNGGGVVLLVLYVDDVPFHDSIEILAHLLQHLSLSFPFFNIFFIRITFASEVTNG